MMGEAWKRAELWGRDPVRLGKGRGSGGGT